MQNRPKIFILFLAVLIHSFLGCAGVFSGYFAKVTSDTAVKNIFEHFQVNSDYDYFISGSDASPRSIMGLKKTYAFESDIWKKVELTPELLNDLVSHMQDKARTSCFQTIFGFAILDNNGKQIGMWYSIMVSGFSVKVIDDHKIMVYPPNDMAYEFCEGRGRR